MKRLQEIILLSAIVLIIYLNGEDCLFALCFGIPFMPGVYFAYLLYCYFLFQKKLKGFNALRADLDQVISKLQTEIYQLKETRLQ